MAADELLLQEIVEYYLNWKRVEQYFELVHQTSFDRNNFAEIQQFCTELMEKSLEKIFKSFDFTSKSLILLIKKDDL